MSHLNNQASSRQILAAPWAVVHFGTGQGFANDLSGNTITDAECRSLIYDAENHQTEVRDAGGFVVGQYFYDGEGKRVKKVSNTETTVFVYDGGGTLVAEYSTQANPTASVKYLTQDHLGSPRIITDQNGTVVSRTDFGAFGDETITPQRTQGLGYKPDNVRQDYTGYQKDDESGLEYAQARYYNPAHGRFTSPDPLTASASIRNPQTFNRYSYALNSPYKFTDPLGLISSSTGACGQCGKEEFGGGGGGVNPVGAGTYIFVGRQAAEGPEPPPPPADYYINRDGTVKSVETTNDFNTYYLETAEGSGEYRELSRLETNQAGLVRFPDRLDFFDRYGTEDAGGTDKKVGETVGQGDHYVRPDVAAALFGLAAVLKDVHGINISFGDMSSSNGSDPWQPSYASKKSRKNGHHSGHGHNGNRSGLDIDFRYVDNQGVSFRSNTATTDKQFSIKNNQTVYDTASKFGFNRNFQGTKGQLKGVPTADGHNNHGHLGYSR